MKAGILAHFVSTEFLAYNRHSVSKGLCKGGSDRKRSSEEKTYKTWQLAGWIQIRELIMYKPMVAALISSKI